MDVVELAIDDDNVEVFKNFLIPPMSVEGVGYYACEMGAINIIKYLEENYPDPIEVCVMSALTGRGRRTPKIHKLVEYLVEKGYNTRFACEAAIGVDDVESYKILSKYEKCNREADLNHAIAMGSARIIGHMIIDDPSSLTEESSY
jgi:hypothetical protein